MKERKKSLVLKSGGRAQEFDDILMVVISKEGNSGLDCHPQYVPVTEIYPKN